MRTIRESARFRREFKRLLRGIYRNAIDQDFEKIVEWLATDAALPASLRDHPLSGEYVGCRDCHIRGDLVLIYRKCGDNLLELVRIGTHSELEI